MKLWYVMFYCLVVFATQQYADFELPITHSFEEPDFTSGDLSGQHAWQVDEGEAHVHFDSDIAADGSGYVIVRGKSSSQISLPLSGIESEELWIDLSVLPKIDMNSPDTYEFLNAAGVRFRVARVGDSKRPKRKVELQTSQTSQTSSDDGASPVWSPTRKFLKIDDATGVAKEWLRLSISYDLSASTFDLYADSKRLISGAPLAQAIAGQASIVVKSHLHMQTCIDSVSVDTRSDSEIVRAVASLGLPEKNFEELWHAFNDHYAFFDVRGVDWQDQYETYRPQVDESTTDDELYEILCKMLKPLNDGHVELKSRTPKRSFCAENPPRFWVEFTDKQIRQLFQITEKTLMQHGFGKVEDTATNLLQYTKSKDYAYLRVLELEGHRKRNLERALSDITADFGNLKGYIIDLRECPGGDDSVLIQIINRFTDEKRVAFHRKTKHGPGKNDFGKLKTWYIEPDGEAQFTGPIVLLTCDSVFSGGDVFAMVARELPHLTIVGEHTNGIFSYQYSGRLSNDWKYNLSNQVYLSAGMICYESRGVPVDVEVLNTKDDLAKGVDPVVQAALEVLGAANE